MKRSTGCAHVMTDPNKIFEKIENKNRYYSEYRNKGNDSMP